MKNLKLIETFEKEFSGWFGFERDEDCSTTNLSEYKEEQIRKKIGNLQEKEDEVILFWRDNSVYKDFSTGLVITNLGIYWLPNSDTPNSVQEMKWVDISRIEYDGVFVIYDINGFVIARIPQSFFFVNMTGEDDFDIESLSRTLSQRLKILFESIDINI